MFETQTKKTTIVLVVAMLVGSVALLGTQTSLGPSEKTVDIPKISPKLFSYLMTTEDGYVKVLIQTETSDYSALTKAIEKVGGSVSHAFKYTLGLAARLPVSSVWDLSILPGIVQVFLDEDIAPASGMPT
ncbi:MAG TPA: hypothetical protein VJ044_12815, partial [Candidatus Hodarchaeales archaeon]|nr:hypothetical protein [Candidatus Hodarchaeales archaeon]